MKNEYLSSRVAQEISTWERQCCRKDTIKTAESVHDKLCQLEEQLESCETALSYALHDAETALVETEKLGKENTLWKSKAHELQKARFNEGHQQLTLDKKWKKDDKYKQNGKSK
jgi:hypothetical protein